MPQPPVHHENQALAYIFNPLVLRHDLGALHEQSQLLADCRPSSEQLPTLSDRAQPRMN
jgi:hypothetical protein